MGTMTNVVELADYRKKPPVDEKPDYGVSQTNGLVERRDINKKIAENNPKIMELAKLLTVARYHHEDHKKYPQFVLGKDFEPMGAFIAQAVAFQGDQGLIDYLMELLNRPKAY
jgi:signal recognition particle subunit SEC65